MSDALVSPIVTVAAGAVAIALIGVACSKIKKENSTSIASTMGIMGAFVFAAQMINFTIPGTGSSGHIIGGVLLAAILGPWAGFVTLTSVLIVQCLVFADGGISALGCNIINMGAMTTLVAYPLIFRPIAGTKPGSKRLMLASVTACIVGLEMGALLVAIETTAGGITAIPFASFLSVMLGIHLAIGAAEGIATGLFFIFIYHNSPSLIERSHGVTCNNSGHRRTLTVVAIMTIVLATTFTWIASSHPDGLEWSIGKILGNEQLPEVMIAPTAVLPDYDSYFAGIIGVLIVLTLLWGFSTIIFHKRRRQA